MLKQIIRKYASAAKMPSCDFQPKPYKGPSLNDLKSIRKSQLSPGLTTYYSEPLAFQQGHKQWLFDLNGNRYLDMFGGICTVSVGHCHPRINKALMEQAETLGHVSNVYYHPRIHEYASRLVEKMPDNLKVVYFVNSGSEANDLAILMSRAYTKNDAIMSLKNSYHGMTYQTMGINSNVHYKYPVPQASGFHKTMNPDVFRGLWGGENCRDSPIQTDRKCSCLAEQCEAGDKYIDQLKNEFNHDIPKKGLAAFFAESIQGVGGTVQYPKNYIKEAYKIVKENGGLFVSDEVQTGFGRTGDHFWGFEMHGIKPDIVTMAKGIGNGFPLGAVVTTPEVATALSHASHFNTFGGNPLSCAVGIAVLDIIKDESLQQNSKLVGTHLLKKLSDLKNEFKTIGDVRGKGLMIGVEMIQEKDGITPLEPGRVMKMWEYCRDNGLIVGKGGIHGNVLRIKPPMCITKDDADFTIEILKEAFHNIK